MDSHVFRKAAWRLPALADLAVLRFNTRGTSSVRGTSEGSFDAAVGERFDVGRRHRVRRVRRAAQHLAGRLVLRHRPDPASTAATRRWPGRSCSPRRCASPAPRTCAAGPESGKPLTALVPEFDDYLRPDEARERFAAVPQAEVVGVPGAKHLWVGDAETVLDEIVRRVNPRSRCRCPTTWDGPMASGDASAYADRTVAAFADAPVPGPQQRTAECRRGRASGCEPEIAAARTCGWSGGRGAGGSPPATPGGAARRRASGARPVTAGHTCAAPPLPVSSSAGPIRA